MTYARSIAVAVVAAMAAACGGAGDQDSSYFDSMFDNPGNRAPDDYQTEEPADDWTPPPEDPYDYDMAAPVTLERGHVGGRVGEITLDRDVNQLDGYAYPDYAAVTSIAQDPNSGSIMTIVEVLGGFDHPAIVDGAQFQNGGWQEYTDPGEIYVGVIGCSGSDVYQWEYDSPADEVEVEIARSLENPNMLSLKYTATFANESGTPTVVSGRFDFVQ
jgi:hypothetical protein